MQTRRPWQEELDLIDRLMRDVSDINDPDQLVQKYWDGVHDLFPVEHYLSLSRRGVEPPEFLVTRSSRFTEHFNPWTQRERLPRLTGGLLGEVVYADKPLVIDDIPARLSKDDPGYFYLQGFQSLIALPHYENGKGLNVGVSLFEPGVEFDHAMVPMMHWQAGLFGRGTQSLVLRNQLSAALQALDRELQVVAQIQRSLLPASLPEIPGFEIDTFYQTSSKAGGDYYDFFPLHDGGWGIFIADVSGHGTPAAVLMAITHAIAHTRPGSPTPPGELLAHLNHHLAKSYTASGSFVTAFYATLDTRTRELTYATAGHNPPRLLRGDRIIALDDGGGLPLGILTEQTYTDARIAIAPGDSLVLYTDGITEAMAPESVSGTRELFGVERLDEIIRSARGRDMATLVRQIRDATTAHTRRTPPTDDQTLVAIRCL
ncbi:PP2C family protein-serine/threonine phosphatase [Nodularia spumigena]|uniref:PP2C family protein-serine/threonine phosphatase n=1 Tax=Nodularia spumigena TaxID=70799 RepID=UPI002B220FAE|nr:PP2C family protein-serine/threonine phosphatase [Nodularia spumigena]MEA5556278.1 PP2C family protein-serine/threonine phosphatase [Nodularia spumigena CH309]